MWPRIYQAVAGLLFLSLSAQAEQLIELPVRHTPVKLYSPTQTCQGIAIVSPGLGSTANSYAYLAKALSRQGYLTLVVGHLAGGREHLLQVREEYPLRQSLLKILTDPYSYQERLIDIYIAKALARQQCPDGPALLVGHSMGSATAMIEAGAHVQFEISGQDTFDLYIVLSPQGIGPVFSEGAWQDIEKPALLITGTHDQQIFGGAAKERSVSYRNLGSSCKWFAVIEDATHFHFAGQGLSKRTERLSTALIADFLAAQSNDCQSDTQYDNMRVIRHSPQSSHVDQ